MVSRWLLSALVLAAVLAGLHGVPCSRSPSGDHLSGSRQVAEGRTCSGCGKTSNGRAAVEEFSGHGSLPGGCSHAAGKPCSKCTKRSRPM
ncbi:hypothetical protein FJT64_020084 [Amphibalanus amphitrite]|uniref:Secreted protein n=1 Tax=Amphibalanus amphitrite TaxID=1232801 RepID=A0A6A4WMR8_AMPAM|nr:hypothetical protein FJT64_020084 [Amphibalanus amphitrite]